MSVNPTPRPRRLGTLKQAADRHHMSERTFRNYASKRFFPLYRRPGVRGVLVDLNEVDAALRSIPARIARAGVGAYGNAIIIDLPPLAEVVVPDEEDR